MRKNKKKNKNIIKGGRLAYPAGVMARYRRKLTDLVEKMATATKIEIKKLFHRPAFEFYLDSNVMDADIAHEATDKIEKLKEQYFSLFDVAGFEAAQQMVIEASEISSAAVAVQIKKISKQFSIPRSAMRTKKIQTIMKASIHENVSLIKSISSDYFSKIEGAVMRSITRGNGLQDLIPEINSIEGVTYRRAKNIALDQTRKVYSNIAAQEIKNSGIEQFEWVHSGGGQHPRPLHVEMNGKIYSFDDLPVIDERTGETGIPGQLINCGCTMIPVVKLEYEFEEE